MLKVTATVDGTPAELLDPHWACAALLSQQKISYRLGTVDSREPHIEPVVLRRKTH